MIYKSQTLQDISIRIPSIKENGTDNTGDTANLSTVILDPSGTELVGTTDYTEATFDEIGTTGVYECLFPSAAAVKAFTSIDQDNPYTVSLVSSTAGVGASSETLRIVSVYIWEIVGLTWDELLAEGNHNIQNSSGKIVRELKENPGYEGGFIYYDNINGEAGDEPHINGTFDKPVNNETDLLALKVALKADQVKIKPGSTLTLTAPHEKQEYIGETWTLNLGGQSISGSFFHGATSVNGIATGTIPPKFEDCGINDVTLPPSRFYLCGYAGTFTAGSAGDYFFVGDSHSGVAGVGTPSFSYGAAIGATNFNFRGYHGGQNIKNMKAGDNLSFDGDGQIIIDSSSGPGTMRIAGHQKITGADAFISAGGVIEDSARFATDQLDPLLDQITGTGNRVIIIHVQDTDTNDIQDVLVRIGEASQFTDVSGDAIFALDDGSYDVILRKQLVSFTVPEPLTVAGDDTHNFTGTLIVPSLPTRPDTCVVYGTAIDDGGNPVEGANIAIKETDKATFSNAQKLVKPVDTTSDADGFWQLEVIRSSELVPVNSPYEAIITNGNGEFLYQANIVVPDQDSAEFSTIIV